MLEYVRTDSAILRHLKLNGRFTNLIFAAS